MSKNQVALFLIIISTFFINNAFVNSYIIIKNNYENRMLKYGGYCEPEGYGFIKFLYKKYNIQFNLDIINYNDTPPFQGYFYRFDRINNPNYLFLIGITDKDFSNIYRSKYKILEKSETCYFLIRK
jgi:hypothetical protein